MTSESTSTHKQNLSFSMEDFAKALEQHDYKFAKGQTVTGKIFQHTPEGAYVDIGGKSPGFVPLREASLSVGAELSESLPLESEMEFLIISEQNADGQVTLSRRQLQLQQAWEQVLALAESESSVQMRVTGTNKGGVVGELEGLKAFIPRSHLIEKNDLESLVGQLLTANFLEVAPERNKLVLSQRAIAKAAAISKLEDGVLSTGRVVNIKPYGVFVDLNGVTGLLHIKEISANRIEDLNQLFAVGQEIKVMVTQVDEVKNRISLSTKLLESFPGEILENMPAVMANAEDRAEKAREQLQAKSE